MLKDAAAINSVSQVVHLQERWLSDQLRSLQVNPGLLYQKLSSLGPQILAKSLWKSQHLPAAVRHISTARLLMASEYWLALKGWGIRAELPRPPADSGKLEGLEFTRDDLEKELSSRSEEILDRLRDGPIPYPELIDKAEGKARIRAAFLLSLMCAQGTVTIRFDPATSRYIVARCSGVPDNSVAIQL
jgi:hypothetical protein